MNSIPLWLDVRGIKDPAAAVAAAQEVGCTRIIHAAPNDIVEQDAVEAARFVKMVGPEQEKLAASLPGRVIIEGDKWTVIPLENLIAARRDRPDSLYALARTIDEVRLFRDTLDIGVHGIVLATADPALIREAANYLQSRGPRTTDETGADAGFSMRPARVTRVEPAGTGDRVCIDCTSAFDDGEGVLVGSTARGFALVHAETIESEFVRARPFRANAGAIHSYVLGPGGRTSYLSELRAGDEVTAASASGGCRVMVVGRAKIERRPHTLVAWEAPELECHTIVQTAETIRFVRSTGEPVSVTDLAIGDEILVHDETEARHFGMPVQERLVER